MPLEYFGLKISWLGHAGFKIRDGIVIYIDPYDIGPGEKADLILLTHEHFDHLSPKDIARVSHERTVIVAPHMAKGSLKGFRYGEVVLVFPGDVVERLGVKIRAVPAYNVSKFKAPGQVFHPKKDERVGYVIEYMGVRIYHAGDTDFVGEMEGLEPDVALLPVSGTYVMTAAEAVQAVKAIRPKLAVPMHYGSFVGSVEDARFFKEKSVIPVQILERERP